MAIEQPTYDLVDYSGYNEASESNEYNEALQLQTEKNEINLRTTEPTTTKKPAKKTSQRFENTNLHHKNEWISKLSFELEQF